MRNAIIYLGLSAAALLTAIHVEAAGYKSSPSPAACRPTVEKWLGTHGHKVEETRAELGAFSERVIRWSNGQRVLATVGPAGDAGICVLASRVIEGE